MPIFLLAWAECDGPGCENSCQTRRRNERAEWEFSSGWEVRSYGVFCSDECLVRWRAANRWRRTPGDDSDPP